MLQTGKNAGRLPLRPLRGEILTPMAAVGFTMLFTLLLSTRLSIPLIACYDGARGKQKWVGKLFYLYYPAHLVAFGLLRLALS